MSTVRSCLALVALAAVSARAASVLEQYVVEASNGSYVVTASNATTPSWAAALDYTPSYVERGWDVLVVTAAAPTVASIEAAGYLEGYVTADRIAAFYGNIENKFNLSGAAQRWVDNHIAFMRTLTDAADPFQRTVQLLLAQLAGLVAGYNASPKAQAGLPLNFTQIFLINFAEEIYDVELNVALNQFESDPSELASYNYARHMHGAFTAAQGGVDATDGIRLHAFQAESRTTPRPPRHCSALVKVTADDVFVSHDTWNHYQTMLRQYKTYRFAGLATVTMSGYPGTIHSVDDWYMTSNRLVAQETTNEFFTKDLAKDVVPATVSEFLRVMTANYIATSAAQWSSVALQYNSGTYNNQWMILDMKLVNLSAADLNGRIPDGTFVVMEQLPGNLSVSEDQSAFLRTNGHWPSYNIPFYKSVFNVSGFNDKVAEQGSFWDYHENSRAKIFAREQSTVVDLASMKNVMRFNQYKTDPFSLIPNCAGTTGGRCDPAFSAMLSIASRGDLNPAVGDYGPLVRYVGQRDHGATDAKIASLSMMSATDSLFRASVVSGPTTYDGLPPFNWSTAPAASFANVKHNMLVDSFNFPFVVLASPATSLQAPSTSTALPTTSLTTSMAPVTENFWTMQHIIIIAAVGGGLLLILALVACVMCRRRGPRRVDPNEAVPFANSAYSDTQPLA